MTRLLLATLLLATPGHGAIRFMDSFDHYNTGNLLQKWTGDARSAVVQTSTVRTGTRALNLTNFGIYRTLDSQGTWTIGFAINYNSTQPATESSILCIEDGATLSLTNVQIGVSITAGGQFRVRRGNGCANVPPTGTLLATSASLSQVGTWEYIEFKVVIGAMGSYDLHLNGASILSASGVNTQATANSTADTIHIQPNSGFPANFFVDDVYMCDGTGASSNTFLGNVKVTALVPNANGGTIQWTPLAGMNFSEVNEIPPDDDTSYNSTSTLNNIDLFTLPALTGTAPLAHQVVLYVKEDASGTRAVGSVIHSGAVTSVGSNFFLPVTYTFALTPGDQDPNTSAAWTLANFNNATWGIKLTQ